MRVVKRAKGETTHYVFQGTEPIFEKRINAGKAKSYVYALGKYLARVDGVIGDSNAKKYFYHTDHAGSIRVITDQAGKVVYEADYFAFGTQFVRDGEFEEFHGFTGKEYDPDIGLYYFNARWYDPDLGRFISEDPVADPNNPNLYSYCGNNPVMRVDPTGKIWWWVFPLLSGLDSYLCGGDFMQGFVMGAFTGALGGAVGSVLQNTAWGAALANSSAFGFSVVSGAIGGGITGELFGEGFEKGAVHGAVAGAISYGVDLRFGEYASRSIYNKLVVAGLKGGLNALARGEDFVEAFAYGAAYGLVAQKIPTSVPVAANHSQQSSLTSLEAAEICKHVYTGEKDSMTDSGWKLIDIKENESGTLRIGVYAKENPVNGKTEYVIANKGTSTLKCWVQNFAQPFGLSSDMVTSINFAREFVSDNPNATITFVGHSKGGAEAAAMAVATNKDAILFNTARPNYGAYGVPISSYEGTMTSYVVRGEILNNAIFFLQKPTENVVYLRSQSWNPITNHGIDSVISALKKEESRR